MQGRLIGGIITYRSLLSITAFTIRYIMSNYMDACNAYTYMECVINAFYAISMISHHMQLHLYRNRYVYMNYMQFYLISFYIHCYTLTQIDISIHIIVIM